MISVKLVRLGRSRALRGTASPFEVSIPVPKAVCRQYIPTSLTRDGARVLKKLFLLSIIFWFAFPDVLTAQEPTKGVVWKIPASLEQSVHDLAKMRDIGISAVRTGPVINSEILSAADSMGIELYRELPLFEYPASRLVDSTRFASSLLRDLLDSGSGHASAGPIGLAVRSDVSNPRACSYFLDVIREANASADQRFYYVGSFVEDDACSDTVDFVLLDLLDDERPRDRLDQWARLHETPAGVAAIGTWVAEGTVRGLVTPNSPEAQARYLEQALSAIQIPSEPAPVFVHRWRDDGQGSGEHTPGSRDVFGRMYGITKEDGTDRPALLVLRGFFLTGQHVFALPIGLAGSSKTPLITILGWVLILIVAILYASSPRFRYMVPRYFLAHGFFRNSVREAREVLPIVSTALLTVIGLSIGIVGSLMITVSVGTAPFVHLARIIPADAHASVASVLSQPIMPVVLLGSISLLAMSAWMGLWVMAASRRAPLLPSQALMLAAWPRWQMLLLLPVAMSIYTLDQATALKWLFFLGPFWIGSALWSTVRTSHDLMKVTRCRLEVAILIWLFNPIWLILSGMVVLAFVYSDEALYLWHLAVRN